MTFTASRRTWVRGLACVMLVVFAALALAACGDDEDDAAATETMEMTTQGGTTAPPPATTETEAEPAPPPATGATVVEIPAVEAGLAYEVTETTAPAGEITLRSVNPQAVPHNIAIDAPDPVEGEIVTDGGVSEVTVTLEPGTYEYYCSVPGHREGGMVGTLIVE
jgi:plastocyanin